MEGRYPRNRQGRGGLDCLANTDDWNSGVNAVPDHPKNGSGIDFNSAAKISY